MLDLGWEFGFNCRCDSDYLIPRYLKQTPFSPYEF